MTLKEQMTDDMKVFLNDDEFATEAVYEGTNIEVIFTNSYDEESEAFYKLVWCRVSDVPLIDKNSKLTVNGVAYGVVDFNADEYGDGISIYLSEELA